MYQKKYQKIYLLKLGADIHADNDSPLIIASYYGHFDVVKFLVKNGADIYANNNEALICASDNGHVDIFNYLDSL